MISIIVPVYNVEKYIRKCVSTLITQTYSDIEIILVDDGSTDASGDICDELASIDKRIRVIHKENGGLSDARNTGIANARGEYIGFVDSDDYVHSSMYETLWKNIENEKADIAYCDFYWIDETEIIQESLGDSKMQVFEGTDILERIYKLNLPTVIAWNKLYRKSLFDSVKFPRGKVHEDEAVIHRLLYLCKKIVYINEKLYYYVKRKGSITDVINITKLADAIDAFEDRMNFFHEKRLLVLETETVKFVIQYLISVYWRQGKKMGRVDVYKVLQEEMRRILGRKYRLCDLYTCKERIEFYLFAYNLILYNYFYDMCHLMANVKRRIKCLLLD